MFQEMFERSTKNYRVFFLNAEQNQTVLQQISARLQAVRCICSVDRVVESYDRLTVELPNRAQIAIVMYTLRAN